MTTDTDDRDDTRSSCGHWWCLAHRCSRTIDDDQETTDGE